LTSIYTALYNFLQLVLLRYWDEMMKGGGGADFFTGADTVLRRKGGSKIKQEGK
jgi:hypothetical protein